MSEAHNSQSPYKKGLESAMMLVEEKKEEDHNIPR